MNDNSLAKLLAVVEPKIQNIEENRVEKTSLYDVLDTMDSLVELGKKSYKEILNFYDQEFLYRAIKIGKFDENTDDLIAKYKSSRYLLNIESDELQELPQFKDAVDFMGNIYKYLCGLNEKIKKEYNDITEKLELKELLYKYYIILKKENIFVKDASEFITFLDLLNISVEDRVNILLQVVKSNIRNYVVSNEVSISSDLNLSNVKDLLDENQDLIGLYYDEFENMEEYLKKNMNNIGESILNVKIYLVNKINELYNKKEYNSVNNYYLDYKYILGLQEELEKQKDNSRKLAFLFKNNKSLVRDYLEKTGSKFRSCILKNLLDLETNNGLILPKMCYNNKYLYIKDDFVVKTVYSFIEDGILVLGVLDKGMDLKDFLKKNDYLIKDIFNKDSILVDDNERNEILKGIKKEDLVLSIDLDTLDVKSAEEENGK